MTREEGREEKKGNRRHKYRTGEGEGGREGRKGGNKWKKSMWRSGHGGQC